MEDRQFARLLQKRFNERVQALDKLNRKGLERSKYLVNVGRIRELLVCIQAIEETLAKRSTKGDDNDDADEE